MDRKTLIPDQLLENPSGGGLVTSVNGQIGDVVLSTTNITEGTNLYYTNARFDTRYDSLIGGTTGTIPVFTGTGRSLGNSIIRQFPSTNISFDNASDAGYGLDNNSRTFRTGRMMAVGASNTIGTNVNIMLGDQAGVAGRYTQIGFDYFFGNTPSSVIASYLHDLSGSNGKSDLIFATRNTGANVAPTERVRIQSDGDVLLGTDNIANTQVRNQFIFNNKAFVSNTGAFISGGTGSPEGVVIAPIGSTFHRTDGGTNSSYYIKESGTSNTGWAATGTGSGTIINAIVPLFYNSGTGNLTIQDAAADGVTKGVATFAQNDFESGSGGISIDYNNGQKVNNIQSGFLTSADWITFSAKEDSSNKVTTLVGANNTTFPSTLAVVNAISSAGGGTVTSFSSGNLSPLFTTNVATSTSTPALSFTLSNAVAHTFLGNNTSSTGTPSYVAIGTGDLPTGIPAINIGIGTVDNTEFGYLDGVTSAIQTQLNGKQATLAYTPEDVVNKSTTTTLGTSNTLYPTQNAVKTYVDNSITTGTSGFVPTTRTITVNGTTQDLSANRTYTIATITGNAGTATALQTARTINTVSFDGTSNIVITAAAGTLTGTTLNSTVVNSSLTSVATLSTGVWNGTAITDTYISSASTWNAKQNAITLTTTGSSGAATFIANVLNIPQYTGGSGSVSSVSVVSANGFTGSVATATTTPAITLSTTITGIIKGDGTAISAATAGTDYTTPSSTEVVTNKNLTSDTNTFPTFNQNTTGSAATLTTSRNINGVAFNGSANITVTADANTLTNTTLNSTVVTSSLTTVGTIGTGTWNASLIVGQYGGTGVNNSGKTITLGGNLTTSGAFATTLTSTATTSVTLPTTGTLATLAGTETLTNKKINKRVSTTASSSTPTPNADTDDVYTITALAANATFGAPTGTPVEGQTLIIRIKDNGTARTLAFNAIYRAGTDVAFPTVTVLSKTMYLGFIYNFTDTRWDLISNLGNI